MPKKKITLDEAFAVFEQHGLKVKVEAVQVDEPSPLLSDFLQQEEVVTPSTQPIGKKQVKITLYSAHTIGNGGEIVVLPGGNKDIINNGIQTYGPGVVTVPVELAQHLLHQDMLCKQTDERMLDRRMRSYVIIPKATTSGVVQCGVQVSENSSFDMSTFLGQLGNSNRIMQL